MNLLITAATWKEVKPLEEYLQTQDHSGAFRDHAVEICVTGIGAVQTAFQLGKMLPVTNWDLAIQLGICGSFKKEYPVGTTIHVVEECFADLGAEDGNDFLDVFEIGLLDENKFPFQNRLLLNHILPIANIQGEVASALPRVRGISVNKVHGNEHSIRQIMVKYAPDVESMEGAAFFYCCKMASVPFVEIRTVSNFVEKRDKSKWDIPKAIQNLNEVAIKIVVSLLQKPLQ